MAFPMKVIPRKRCAH